MKQFLNIDENEKKRILEMHETAVKNHYLNEQGTPPQQQPMSSTGTVINGKTYTVERITDNASLMQFINWGTPRWDEESKKEIRPITVDMVNTATGSALTALPEKPEAGVDSEVVAKTKRVYSDLDLIAQNYKISELCASTVVNKRLPLQNPKSLQIAKNRAVALGWCARA